MRPISYQVVGEEDYALRIQIGDDGDYIVESGTYTSEPPRKGQLDEEQEMQLFDAIRELGIPREHPLPPGTDAFEAQLTIGSIGDEVSYRFWEGALEEDRELNRLIRLLERL